MKKIFILGIFSLVLQNLNAQIVGGSGIIITKSNPNTISTLKTIDQRSNGIMVWDSVARKLWRYNHILAENSRWQGNDSLIIAGVAGGSADNLGNHTASQNLLLSGFRVTEIANGINLTDGVNRIQLDSAANRKWNLLGNSGTTAGTNFLGTTDAQDLVFKTNNVERFRYTNNQLLSNPSSTDALPSYSTSGSVGTGLRFTTTEIRGSINGTHRHSYTANRYLQSGVIQTNTIINGGNETMTGGGNTLMGFIAGAALNTGSENTIAGASSGYSLTTGAANSVFGRYSMPIATTSNYNTVMGTGSLVGLTTGNNNTVLGASSAIYLTSGTSNTIIGYNAFNTNVLGSGNVAIGGSAAGSQVNTENSVYIGEYAGSSYDHYDESQVYTISAVSGNELTFTTSPFATNRIGTSVVLRGLTSVPTPISTTSPNAFTITAVNKAMFNGTLTSTTTGGTVKRGFEGYNNISIGYSTRPFKINQTVIGSSSNVETILTGKLGIDLGNMVSPTNTLHVKASSNPIRMEGLQNGSGTDEVLTVDATGVFKKRTSSALVGSAAWGLTGNLGTTPTTNFLGTTDNQPLVFRTNNTERLRLETDGRLSIIGTNANTFVGNLSGNSTVSGLGNNGFGERTLNSLTSGLYNTASGWQSGYTTTTGNFNTFYGANSGRTVTTGGNNTIVGYDNGNTTVTTGTGNTIVGFNSGNNTGTGSNNTTIGLNASVGANVSNSTAIGKNALATNANTMVLGGTGTDAVNVGIGTSTPTSLLHAVQNGGTPNIKVENTGSTIASFTVKNTLGEYSFLKTNADANFYLLDNTNTVGFLQYRPTNNTLLTNGTGGVTVLNNGNTGVGETAPKSTLTTSGSFGVNISPSVASSSYTALSTDHTIRLTLNAAQTVTLPTASTATYRIYVIVNVGSLVKTVSTYLDFGNANSTTIPANGSITLQSDGTNWYRIQ